MNKLIITLIALNLSFSTWAADKTNAKAPSFQLKPVPELQDPPSNRFPGDPPEHKAVYMWNEASDEYQKSIINSIKAMIGKYSDNVSIAVVVIGPGLHALAKQPKRPVNPENRERIKSFAKDYNVRFIVCGNTMKSLHWEDNDILPFAEYAEVGASALMELQEEGYKLLVW